MHEERRRHARPVRSLRRTTDRVEDLVAWVLIAVALFTAVVAGTVALGLYDAGMRRVEAETRERTQVQAVLLEPARLVFTGDQRGQGVRTLPVSTPVRFTAPDGTERRADAPVEGGLPAGATAPIWLDRSGAVTGEPVGGVDALGNAVSGAGVVLAVGAAVLGGIWIGVRGIVLRLDMTRWEREWERVEPQWSGRAP